MHYDHEGGHIDPCEQEQKLRFRAQRLLVDWQKWHANNDSHHEQSELVDAAVSSLPDRYRAVLVEEYLRGEKRRPTKERRAMYLRMSARDYCQMLDTAKMLLVERVNRQRQIAELRAVLSKSLNREQNRAQQAEVA